MQIMGLGPISPVATKRLSGEKLIAVTSSMWFIKNLCTPV
jgi:hypothetical protein